MFIVNAILLAVIAFLTYKLWKKPSTVTGVTPQEVENIVKANIERSCKCDIIKDHNHKEYEEILIDITKTLKELTELVNSQTDVLLDLEKHQHDDLLKELETQQTFISEVSEELSSLINDVKEISDKVENLRKVVFP